MTKRLELFNALMSELGLHGKPQSLIGGSLRDGAGAEITLEDPFARIVLAKYADCDIDLANEACEYAVDAQKRWMQEFSAAERGNVMQSVATVVEKHLEPLAQLEALAAGKPIRDCRVEVAKVVEMFRYYSGWADKLHGEVIPVPSGHLNYTLREPLGVVF